MDLALFSAFFLAFSLTMYMWLDGFDLGVGMLLLVQRHQALRDHMVDSIWPIWDGNETWLVMTGITLFAGFPLAYGILMPAFYIPLIAMLLALGLRGVSFEFRVQRKNERARWDVIFGVGSLVAAFMQGAILGGLIEGIPIQNNEFAGSAFHGFGLLPILSAATVVAAYIALGGGWLLLKSRGMLRGYARRVIYVMVPAFVILFTVTCALGAIRQPAVRVAWQHHGVGLSVLCVFMGLAAITMVATTRRERHLIPLLAGFAVIGIGLSGFVWVVFPDIVPFQLSLWEASSSHLSQVFLLTGVSVVTPVVLAYSGYAYWVFRGPTPEKGWDV